MYKFKPERSPRQALILVICLSVLSCAGFFAPSLITDPRLRLLMQIIAVLFFVMSISIVVRYTITEIEYAITPDSFTVSKKIGNKITVLCSLDLTTNIALVDKKTYKDSKDFSDVTIRFNHCQNIKAQSFVFVYFFNSKKGMIEFEPNAVFVKIMSEAIENAKNNNEDNNDTDKEKIV